MSEPKAFKDNLNIALNIVLVGMSAGVGFLIKEIYVNVNKTREDVAVIQSQQVAYTADMTGIKAELFSLRTKIQANEIEIIKLQRAH